VNRPVHFEILADEPDELSKFYESVFGWSTSRWDGGQQVYWLVRTGAEGVRGIDGGFMHRHFEQRVINTIAVENLEDTLRRIEEAGGRKVLGPNEIPGIGSHAYCEDTEGTLFGVLQPVLMKQSSE